MAAARAAARIPDLTVTTTIEQELPAPPMRLHGDARIVAHHAAMLRDLGVTLPPGATVLDFGCGSGGSVYQYRAAGYQGFGVDFSYDWNANVEACIAKGLATPADRLCRALEVDPYRIPFPDETFDFVFSEQVFEHVQDYDAAIAEVRRVLKPGGVCLHDFPARWRPIEAHVYVPLAGAFPRRAWLALWARLGIRNEFQRGMPAAEVVRRNHDFLRANTNYPSRAAIARHFRRHFPTVRFVEDLFIQHSYGRLRMLARAARLIPGLPRLVSAFHTRVVFCRRG